MDLASTNQNTKSQTACPKTLHGKAGSTRCTPADITSNFKAGPRTALFIELAGANPDVEVSGQAPLSGKTNYLVGKNASKWHTNVPNYQQVQYKGVYPGIDLTYYGKQNQLEYDFTVAAHVNPDAISLKFEGADRMELNSAGQIVLHLGDKELREQAPIIYQEINGKKEFVKGGYVSRGKDQIGFEIRGQYDHARPLVIDPVLGYATYLGGGDAGYGIAVDSAGEAYVIGSSGNGFPTTPGSYQPNGAGGGEVFVSKLNPDGTGLVYSTFVGGSDDDFGKAIALDNAGNAYITGYTYSVDFPTTTNAPQPFFSGGITGTNPDPNVNPRPSDAFVAELSAAGDQLLFSTYLGGSGNDFGQGIAVRNSNVYVTGSTTSSDFITTTGAYQTTFKGSSSDPSYPSDAFVTELNAAAAVSTTALIYSTYLGGSTGDDFGTGLAVDSSGNAYVGGYTTSTDYITTTGAYQTAFGGGPANGFVTKLNPNGTSVFYSTYIAGGADSYVNGIAVDANGNAFVAGMASGGTQTTPNAYQSTYGGGPYDAFVTKLSADGTSAAYSTYLGSNGDDRGGSIALDANTVTFYDQNGNALPTATQTLTLKAHSSQTLDQTASNNGLPSGFYGWASIIGANGAQLVAQVLETRPDLKFMALTNGQPLTPNGLNQKLYAPAIFKGAFGGFYTGANVVNPNSNSVSVTVTYYDYNGKVYATTPFQLGAYAVAPIYQGANHGNGLPTYGLPDGFYGSAIVTSMGGGIVMVVNEAVNNTTSHGTVRSGIYAAATNGSPRLGLPVAANNSNGYNTGTTILNCSNSAVSGNISYYNPDGTQVGIAQSFTLAAHSSLPIYQGGMSQLAHFYGQAIVTTNDSSHSLIATTNAQSDALFFTYTESGSGY